MSGLAADFNWKEESGLVEKSNQRYLILVSFTDEEYSRVGDRIYGSFSEARDAAEGEFRVTSVETVIIYNITEPGFLEGKEVYSLTREYDYD